MNGNLSRRSLLAGASCVVAGGSVATSLLSVVRAQEAASGEASIVLAMTFESGRGAKFDAGKYVSQHLPLLRKVYGDSVERIELRTAAGTVQGVPSPLLAAVSVWVRDVRSFRQALQASSAEINKDLESVSKGTVIAQVEKLAARLGEERSSVPVNTQVVSTYFPAQEGKTFDPDYYANVYIPKLYSLYGSTATRRVEVTLASPELGNSRPHLLASSHVYVRDREAYDAAAGRSFAELMRDTGKYTTITPYFVDARLTAIG